MNGYSPKLPLQKDNIDGIYLMNKTSKDTIKQNFKILLLTNPGERVMDSAFGVGLKKFLFEQNDNSTYSLIEQKILSGVSNYLPYINLLSIDFLNNNLDENSINIKITYSIPALATEDEILI